MLTPAGQADRKTTRRTRRLIADRRLVVVDIENLVGGACALPESVSWARRALETAIPPSPGDQIVIGTSHIGLLTIACNWPHLRYVVGSGVNGADLKLLHVLNENLAERFGKVILVSGDGIFTDAVSSLGANGVRVCVVSHRHGLSRRLAMAAAEIVYIDQPTQNVAARDASWISA